jgi:hypothetical protein
VIQECVEDLKRPRDSQNSLPPGSSLVGQPESVSQNPAQFGARRQEREIHRNGLALALKRLHQWCIAALDLGEIVLSEHIVLDLTPTLTGATMPHRLVSQ